MLHCFVQHHFLRFFFLPFLLLKEPVITSFPNIEFQDALRWIWIFFDARPKMWIWTWYLTATTTGDVMKNIWEIYSEMEKLWYYFENEETLNWDWNIEGQVRCRREIYRLVHIEGQECVLNLHKGKKYSQVISGSGTPFRLSPLNNPPDNTQSK